MRRAALAVRLDLEQGAGRDPKYTRVNMTERVKAAAYT
jgi:hypothetical protein